MKAAVVTENGVQVKDAPKPEPKPNEILIKVRAASLNRADLAVAAGNRHGTVGGPGTIVGLECAGEVEAVGNEVKDFKPGDRVMFESNFPPDKQSCGYTELWNAFKIITKGASAAEKTALYSGTAARVYKMIKP